MEKTENTLYVTQNTLVVTQNTLFVNQMTKNTLFYGIITYAHGEHGEHDSGSAQDWRTLSDLWRLLSALPVKPL